MKHQTCLVFLLLSLACLSIVSASLVGGKGTKLGGWSPIKDPKDPHVVEIGEFAVSEYNKKSETNLKFESVVSGESQVVAGTNYKLILEAKDGVETKKYEAAVYERPWEHYRSLTSFEAAN